VAGSCKYGVESSDSDATELVSVFETALLNEERYEKGKSEVL
jgi:hypothetical protein